MIYRYKYHTPQKMDDIILEADDNVLIGLWFIGSKDESKHKNQFQEKKVPVIEDTIKWLDVYFHGKQPDFIPKHRIDGLTPFRKEVFDVFAGIPYGKSISYGEIAKIIAVKRGVKKMSSRAVGAAVGFNPICIIIPCHRVLGSDSSLTGYGGGIKNKAELLRFEKISFVSKKGIAQ